MTELIDWKTYSGSGLHKVGFDDRQLDTLHGLFKETRVNGDRIDQADFLKSVRYNSVLVGSDPGGITALGVYNYQPYSRDSYVYVEALAVDEEYRRRGVGSLAISSIIQEAIELECTDVRLSSRKTAVDFYRAHGFSYDYSIDTNSPYVPMRLYLSHVNTSEETTLRSLIKSV